MNRCAKCREEKMLDLFGRNSQSRDGRSSYCRDCYREMHSKYRQQKATREGRVVRQRLPRREGEKWCPDCQEYKLLDDFGRNRTARDGRVSYCKRCQSRRAKESRERLHGSTRHYHLLRRYGISAADAAALLDEQEGRCAICNRDLGDKPHVDHDHESGAIRGLLCFNCNGGLGQFGDDAERLRDAILYLEHWIPGRAAEARFERYLRRAGVTTLSRVCP